MNIIDFFASLEIMIKGMIGLFGVCIFIMLIIMLIYRLLAKNNKKNP
jgi:hypothetical protein